jgi:hypothetical protein
MLDSLEDGGGIMTRVCIRPGKGVVCRHVMVKGIIVILSILPGSI